MVEKILDQKKKFIIQYQGNRYDYIEFITDISKQIVEERVRNFLLIDYNKFKKVFRLEPLDNGKFEYIECSMRCSAVQSFDVFEKEDKPIIEDNSLENKNVKKNKSKKSK